MHSSPSRSPARAASAALLAALAACSSATLRPGSVRGPAYGGGPAPLVGGVTDDNVRLPDYLAYVEAYPHRDVPKLDLTDRQIVTVLDGSARPLWDVGVRVDTPTGPYETRTNAAGAFLLPRAALGLRGPANVAVEGRHAGWVDAASDVLHLVNRSRRAPQAVRLDVALVVDTTSSMDDEVARLRATLQAFVASLRSHPLRPLVRVGGVAYRDVGDRYVTAPFEFTSDLAAVQRRIDTLDTAGGGDTPEAVQEALDVAVNRLAWGGEGTVRVLFLVGDAPPHFERGVPYTVTMRAALARGITIFPVACSDMDDTGEFVWRQLAAVTLGQFLFVSYGGGTDHHTGPYLENDLDVLMTRAVLAQLDAVATGAPAIAPVAVTPPAAPPGTMAPAPAPWAPAPYVHRVAPDPASPSATYGQGRDRVGTGRSPWDFGIPGLTR